jgi:hypothetical protein
MSTTRTIPNDHNEGVLGVECNAISLLGSDRGIGVSDVQCNLAQLPVEGLVNLISIQRVGNDAGKNAHYSEKKKKPDEQTTPQ